MSQNYFIKFFVSFWIPYNAHKWCKYGPERAAISLARRHRTAAPIYTQSIKSKNEKGTKEGAETPATQDKIEHAKWGLSASVLYV